VEIYGRVRRAVRVEGRSQRAVAREFGLSRETVRKMLEYAVPPGYQRQQPIKRPKLGPWLGVIDAILADDKQRPVKQRHTAKRIFDRLRDEHRFTGGYTIVKDYVRGEQPGHHTTCGILMHSSLAVTTEGLPLGLAAIKFWSRDKFHGANALKRSINPTRVPIEQKESYLH